MIIWWRGLGIWVLFIVGGVVVASQLAFSLIPPETVNYHGMPMGVSMLLAALACWRFGEYTRTRRWKGVYDESEGELVLDHGHHSLFFIPVHFWTYIIAAGGAVLLFQELTR